MNHREQRAGQRDKHNELSSLAPIFLLLKNYFALRALPCAIFLCFLCSSLFLADAQNQTHQTLPAEKRLRYQIALALDFDNRTYTGTERVHWVNRGDHPASALFFHLYQNMRTPDYVAPTQKNEASQIVSDEPRIDISGVRAADNGGPPSFSLHH